MKVQRNKRKYAHPLHHPNHFPIQNCIILQDPKFCKCFTCLHLQKLYKWLQPNVTCSPLVFLGKWPQAPVLKSAWKFNPPTNQEDFPVTLGNNFSQQPLILGEEICFREEIFFQISCLQKIPLSRSFFPSSFPTNRHQRRLLWTKRHRMKRPAVTTSACASSSRDSRMVFASSEWDLLASFKQSWNWIRCFK